jgi:pyruvate dehydrogenase E1 component alpha subunit
MTAYERMRTIREFEDRVHAEFATGKIPGFVHLYAGEEASAVGVCTHLADTDYVASNHRGHGHCIAKGCDVEAMMKEIYGRRDGLCGGKGGSMHIADLDKGMMGANGIVGGGPPLVCGAALTAKTLKTGGVAVAFVGDGGSNQGTTLESYNLANVWNLPVIFVVEDNGYAETTASAWSVGGSQLKRAEAFGMPGALVNGHDFFEVAEAAKEAIDRARAGEGPSLIHVKVDRHYGHFEGDAQTYRADGEQDRLRAQTDCLKIFRDRVTETGLLEDAQLDDIDATVAHLIDKAVSEAEGAAPPSVDDLKTDVYVSY